jgi:hypothetical protein
MTLRSGIASTLLLLAALSVGQAALDGASFRTLRQQQWRGPTHHHGVARLSRRNASGIPAESPAAAVPTPGSVVVIAECPEVAPPLLSGIFVPPRI